MKPKEYIINVLRDISRISNRIRIDMLKNILGLPLLMYVDNVGDWIRQFGFKLEERYVSFETEVILNLIEKLDKKFDEWEKSEKKYYLFDGKEENHEDHVSINDVSDAQKFQILRTLAFLDDVEVIELYQTIQSIIDRYKNDKMFKTELLTSIPEGKLPQNPEELITIISKKYSFDTFINFLREDISTHKLYSAEKLLEKPFSLRRDLKSKHFDFFNEEFKRTSGIEPINLFDINEHFFFFFTVEDYFVAKSKLASFKKRFHLFKIFLLKEEKSIINLIFSIFPDAHLVDYKNQTITVQNLSDIDQFEPEVFNELFNNYIIHSNTFEIKFLRKKSLEQDK